MVHAQDEGCCADGQADPGVAAGAGLVPWPCLAEADAVRVVVEACRRTGDPQRLVFESDDVLRRVDERGDLFEPVLKLNQKLPKTIG